MAASGSAQTGLAGFDDGLCAFGDLQFGEDVGYVVASGLEGDHQFVGDRCVALMPFVTARISSSTVLILLLHKGISLLRHAHDTMIIGGSRLTELGRCGCRIVATIRASEYEKFQPSGEVRASQSEVMDRFHRIRLDEDQDERDRIANSVMDARSADGVRRYGVAEYAGGADLAVDRFDNGKATNPLGIAIVRAAADWRRLGLDVIPDLDHDHATNLGSYARFLDDVLKDPQRAEAMFERAITAGPDHATNLARLLFSIRRDEVAQTRAVEALSLANDQSDLSLRAEYRYYLFALSDLHRVPSGAELKHLLSIGITTGAWSFGPIFERLRAEQDQRGPLLAALADALAGADPRTLTDFDEWRAIVSTSSNREDQVHKNKLLLACTRTSAGQRPSTYS